MALQSVNLSNLNSNGLPRIEPSMTRILDIVLKTIRNAMPIETLFTPELKINLTQFIKDQRVFYKIATLLRPLSKTEDIDINVIEKVLQESDLLADIQALFSKDPAPYLKLLYEACLDVLQSKSLPGELKTDIAGRIFTLKNGLIAQHTPDVIRKSQEQNKISPQTEENIKKGGAHFIRESINLYFQIIETPKNPSFKEELILVVNQLIPFVQKITRMYLEEHGEHCSNNPLTFRNPKGYNHHGLVAAAVMEVCLSALGYSTRLLKRCDLEPKVTLATAHRLVEVNALNGSKFLVDPTYLQFHKDVCLEETELPTAPALVLEEGEVDAYIEKQIMPHWKSNLQRIAASDQEAIKKLKKNDQLIALTIKHLSLPLEYVPSDPKAWVRKSFKRVWEISNYSPVLYSRVFEDLLQGTGQKKKSYEFIKAMTLANLANRSSCSEIEKELDALLQDHKIQKKNSSQALSLIAQLPNARRNKYQTLLDLDSRLKVNPLLNAYVCSLKKLVNPEGKNLKVIYGCSGADALSVFLATDAEEVIFVDMTQTSLEKFPIAIDQIYNQMDQLKPKLDAQGFDEGLRVYMGSLSNHFEGVHTMENLAEKFLINLWALKAEKVSFTSEEGCVQIDFSWQYKGAVSPKKRRVIFITADLTNPEKYPPLLQKKIEQGFDIFYMKGAFLVPNSYPQFLPYLAKFLNPKGWLMTTDQTVTMEKVDPTPCLTPDFIVQESEEKKSFEKTLIHESDPFQELDLLKIYPPHQRLLRNPGTDSSYWSILTLRQKT